MTALLADANWVTLGDEVLRKGALDAALLIARRATDPDQVSESLRHAESQTRYPTMVRWDAWSVAQGDAGQALLCSRLHDLFPAGGWDLVAQRHLERASKAVEAGAFLPVGAISGHAGLLFAGRQGGGLGLRRCVPGLEARMAETALETAAGLYGRTGVAFSAFDLISGLSGVALSLVPTAPDQPASPLLPFVLRALGRFVMVESDPEPWYTPVDWLYDDVQRQLYPFGNLNLGLAHGIPGPLAAMALAASYDADLRDELEKPIRRLGDWVADSSFETADGPSWPTVIPLGNTAGRLHRLPVDDTGRDAWCYGTPGVARALFLASAALGVDEWRARSIETMAAVYRRPPEMRNIDSPTFCHGVAGLLQITLRFLADTGEQMFAEEARKLTESILSNVDPDRPMGIAAIEPDGTAVDLPGVLDGAAGVSLVLLSVAGGREPSWDRLFGLA